jgi:uncharacterized protein with ParB-like and HNH nuclease domain
MGEYKEIQGKAKTIRELLGNQKYAIDYYQREYKWEPKQVQELLDDLSNKFFENYEPGHERLEVEKYGHYFLGSIIISARNGKKFLIDGQQRLTTLTLLLTFVNNLQRDRRDVVKVDELIYSERYAKKSFNLDIDERALCMESLFNGQIPDNAMASESVQNIIARYMDIAEYLREDLKGEALPYFIDWLLENVHLVEITAYSDDDAYTIFETMNDRGLSLTPPDMLKGFLLANIIDEDKRNAAAVSWKQWLGRFRSISKDDEPNFFKAWLRSQYAESIRERKRAAKPEDFDLLGTEFHRWIRDNRDRIGLSSSNDFEKFITKNMAFYARWYEKIRKASLSLTPRLEEIYYNALHEFTLQYPVLLSPLKPDEPEELSLKKLKIAASFLDIMIIRRVWNYRDISASTMQYAMFLVMRELRDKSPLEMAELLTRRLEEDTQPLESGDFPFSLHGANRTRIKLILARITDYLEQRSGMPSQFEKYVQGRGQRGFDVEHIWADHYERHSGEFSHPSDFQSIRNRIGGLLLLPKQFNQSYGDLPYEAKLPHYLQQNLLAQSLNPSCYDHNPGFIKFISDSNIPFGPHVQFKKADVEKRQQLYKLLAEQVWNPSRLKDEAVK